MCRLPRLGLSVAAVCVFVGAMFAQTIPPLAPPDKTIVILRLPADATVTIDGKSMTQKGTERFFITPTLEPGYTYFLELAARWTDMDRERFVKRRIAFKAGQSRIVDLTQPEPDDIFALNPEK